MSAAIEPLSFRVLFGPEFRARPDGWTGECIGIFDGNTITLMGMIDTEPKSKGGFWVIGALRRYNNGFFRGKRVRWERIENGVERWEEFTI